MTFAYSIHDERNLAYFRMPANIGVTGCADMLRRYVEDPRFDPGRRMLTDATEVTEIDASFLGIIVAVERLAPLIGRFSKKADSVLLVASGHSFGMARMMQQVVEPVSALRFHITHDVADALHLAGQTDTDLTALNAAHDAVHSPAPNP